MSYTVDSCLLFVFAGYYTKDTRDKSNFPSLSHCATEPHSLIKPEFSLSAMLREDTRLRGMRRLCMCPSKVNRSVAGYAEPGAEAVCLFYGTPNAPQKRAAFRRESAQ